MPKSMGVPKMPGAMVMFRMPLRALTFARAGRGTSLPFLQSGNSSMFWLAALRLSTFEP
jgi:hypothetical protein